MEWGGGKHNCSTLSLEVCSRVAEGSIASSFCHIFSPFDFSESLQLMITFIIICSDDFIIKYFFHPIKRKKK